MTHSYWLSLAPKRRTNTNFTLCISTPYIPTLRVDFGYLFIGLWTHLFHLVDALCPMLRKGYHLLSLSWAVALHLFTVVNWVRCTSYILTPGQSIGNHAGTWANVGLTRFRDLSTPDSLKAVFLRSKKSRISSVICSTYWMHALRA